MRQPGEERLQALEQEVERLRAELAARDLTERARVSVCVVCGCDVEGAQWEGAEVRPEGLWCGDCVFAANRRVGQGSVIETQADHAAWEGEPEGWVCATCGEEQEEDSSPACSSGGVWVCAACADETTRERER